jgi:integrase
LGRYTGLSDSLEQAKERAKAARKQIEDGLDPKIEKKKKLDIPTLAKFIEETFLPAQKLRLRAGSYKPAKAMLDKLVVPVLGEFRVPEIQREQVASLFMDVARGWRPGMKPSEKPAKATPIRANRMLANLRKCFFEAEKLGLRAPGSNPCLLIEKNPESRGKERFLSMAEFEWLGKVLKDAPKWGDRKACPYAIDPKTKKPLELPSVYALAAIKLLMLTGARLNEILQLRWSQVDRKRGVIRITQHKTSGKTGAKELPLNSAAMAVLEQLDELPTRKLKGEWVIQGHKHGEHLVNLQKPWTRIRTAVGLASKGKVKILDLRLHDLRHSFASVGVGEGLSLHQVGNLLGHAQASTTHRYAHLDVDPRLQASEKIGAAIAAALG